MKIKTTLAVIALALTPTWVLAQGCSEKMETTTSAASCAEGFVWDAAVSACVEQGTS
jgi:hypothetical protein